MIPDEIVDRRVQDRTSFHTVCFRDLWQYITENIAHRSDTIKGVIFEARITGHKVFEKIGEPAKTFLLTNFTDPNPDNRGAAILGLYLFKNEEIIKAFINALDDPDETVRKNAENSLCDSEMVNYLLEAQNKTTNPGLKNKINDIIEEIGRIEKLNL